MAILLTGANGFLGKVIVKELQNNHSVFELSRTSGNYKVYLEKEIPKLDKKFELVIHAAGKAHSIPKTEEEKNQFYGVNVIGTQNLLKGLEIVGVPEQFVFISSVSVYGQESGLDIPEDFPLLAKDSYGSSKIEAEKIIADWCQKNNVICTILRLPLLVGENPPGNLGTMKKALKKGYYFNVDGGKARKSMVLASDVACLIPFVSKTGGIYNLTDGYNPNFKELSKIISGANKNHFNLPLFGAKILAFLGDFLGNKAPINSTKLKKIISDLTFDDSKARKLLNWNPQPVLDYLKNNNI